jgi:hypothetical protein
MKKNTTACILALSVFSLCRWAVPATDSAAAQRADRKVKHIQANGALAHPDPAPTVFTEAEINAYVASGKIQLPEGVQSVHLSGSDGAITGTARVDFDRVRAGRRSSNPLLSIFSGVHDIAVEAHAHGEGGQGMVHVDSVSLDGMEVPNFVLELFMEKFVQPKYPQVGIDSRFTMPNKVDTAVVGKHVLTVTQK